MEPVTAILFGFLLSRAFDGGVGGRQAQPIVLVVSPSGQVTPVGVSGGGLVRSGVATGSDSRFRTVQRKPLGAPPVNVVYFKSQGLDCRKTDGQKMCRWEYKDVESGQWCNYAWRDKSSGQLYRTANANGIEGCRPNEIRTSQGPQNSQAGSSDCKRCHLTTEVYAKAASVRSCNDVVLTATVPTTDRTGAAAPGNEAGKARWSEVQGRPDRLEARPLCRR